MTKQVNFLDTSNSLWKRIPSGNSFNYPIDYWMLILGQDKASGRIDFLTRWAPNSYCHYHRHLGETTSVVIEGEHHLHCESTTETYTKVRRPGSVSRAPAGDFHMEKGGPNGSLLFFSMECKDKYAFEILDNDGGVIAALKCSDFVAGTY